MEAEDIQTRLGLRGISMPEGLQLSCTQGSLTPKYQYLIFHPGFSITFALVHIYCLIEGKG